MIIWSGKTALDNFIADYASVVPQRPFEFEDITFSIPFAKLWSCSFFSGTN
jgi:hypothetical protein